MEQKQWKQSVQANSTIHGNVDESRLEVHVWWQFAASRPAIFHRGKSGEMVQKGSNHPRFGRAIRAHPHCCPSLYLFPSTSPFPDYSAFYLAHRCLSDRTPDTIFPLSSLSIPRTIIPRFISHRERKPVLLPFIGHTDEAQSFQRDTIYYYMLRFVHSLRNPDSYHSSRV